eukprot:9473446-Pyramimonas_sp.AAC.2
MGNTGPFTAAHTSGESSATSTRRWGAMYLRWCTHNQSNLTRCREIEDAHYRGVRHVRSSVSSRGHG